MSVELPPLAVPFMNWAMPGFSPRCHAAYTLLCSSNCHTGATSQVAMVFSKG